MPIRTWDRRTSACYLGQEVVSLVTELSVIHSLNTACYVPASNGLGHWLDKPEKAQSLCSLHVQLSAKAGRAHQGCHSHTAQTEGHGGTGSHCLG